MKKYVELFLKIKVSNNKSYFVEECELINKSQKMMGLDLIIKSENTCQNPGNKE